MNELIFSYLTGRNRTGSEPGGTLIHAIRGDGEHFPTFRPALCGAKPGRRSNGWSELTSDHATCPKCLKKLGIQP